MASKKHLEWALPVGTLLKSPQFTYKVESILGTGGFGITYKVSAEVKLGNIPVHTFFAIKEHYLSDCCERNPDSNVNISRTATNKYAESLADFKAEAIRLNELSGKHQGIVRVNEVFQANNTIYYVMEYLNGSNIRSLVNASGPFSESNALNIIREVGSAVEFLHSQRITHLDIKPDNIMLHTYNSEEDSYPVLIDFGLAKHYDSKGKPTSTVRVQGCSDGYSPMEQYVRINEFSPFADVYALAATLFFMLTGKDPVIASEMSKDYILGNLPQDISDRTRNAIVQGMKKEKSERTQTIRQFLDNLDAPYTLPFGYKLKTANGLFLITSVNHSDKDRIVYDARKANNKTSQITKNITQTLEYRITEFYSKEFCQRGTQGEVTIIGNHDDEIQQFKSDVMTKCGLSCWGTSRNTNKGVLQSETLETNGTLYGICLNNPTPKQNHYLWYGVAVLCLCLGLCLANLFHRCGNGVEPVVEVMEEEALDTPTVVTQQEEPIEVQAEENDTIVMVSPMPEIPKPLSQSESTLEQASFSELEKLAKRGNAEAQYWLGWHYYNLKRKGNSDLAASWWERSAKAGFVPAIVMRGWCYYNGVHYSKNYGKAVEFYKLAARKKSSKAKYLLGLCYYDGFYQGTKHEKQNFKEAVSWLTQAADEGYGPAQFYLGRMYYVNEFNYKKPLYTKAFKLLTQAAEQDITESEKYLGECYYYLGQCYQLGRGTQIDQTRAKEYKLLAKKKGFTN